MTSQEAIEKEKSLWWLEKSDYDIVEFQINEPLLCMDYKAFQSSVRRCLGRTVFMHEFSNIEKLKKEWEGMQ